MIAGVANTYSYLGSHAFEACVDELVDAGFRRVEAMIGPGHLWPDALDAAARSALARGLAARGVVLETINQPNLDLNLASADPAMRAHTVRRFTDAVRLAGDLGCPRVVIGPGKANPLAPAPRASLEGWLLDALRALDAVARPLRVRLLLENMPFAFMPRFDDLHAFATRAGDLVGGLVFDVANAWFVGEDPAAAMAAADGAIALVHVSDTGRDRYAHAPIGAGDVPWRDTGAAYAALVHAPPVVAEIVSARPRDDLPGAFARLRELGWAPDARSPARAA